MMTLSDIALVWIAIVLEALPFVLLGSALAAVVETLVPPRWLERALASSGKAGIALASVLGLVVPVCDCAVFPVVRKLLAKGWAPSHATAFLCASASLSPAVLAATWWAFPQDPRIAFARAATGILAGWVAGGLVGKFWGRRSPLRKTAKVMDLAKVKEVPETLLDLAEGRSQQPSACCGHEHGHTHIGARKGWMGRGLDFFHSMADEFSENMVYILAGSLVAAAVQVLVPSEALIALAGHPFLAVPAMMAWGFVLCLCAHADAFVASSFVGILPPGALLAFMAFGGILDAKNFLLWWSSFRPRFVLMVLAAVVAVVMVAGLAYPLVAAR
ncbi:MAG: permease [Fibrobacteres bacterium]|nr:permease [Fibrobacterota bacterium]